MPGPAAPLTLAGATIPRLWPAAVLAANVRLGVAAASYAGRLGLGIHFDAAYVDRGAVADAIGDELAAIGS